MYPRPPADAVAALRGLERRYRGLFAGLEDDESPEDLAHRNGADGRSAIDHIVAASRTLTFLGRGIEQALVEDDPVLHPAVADPAEREWPPAEGTVEDALAELGRAATTLADRVAHVPASSWDRHVRVAGHDATTTPLTVLWDAVDSAVAHLKHADTSLEQARRHR
jgi:hypothetical protein